MAQLEDLVDLLQTRCRELEDESRELGASKLTIAALLLEVGGLGGLEARARGARGLRNEGPRGETCALGGRPARAP